MLMTKQQVYLLDVVRRLGCIRHAQLTALFLPAFCAAKPEAAARVVSSAMRQLTTLSGEVTETDGVYHLPQSPPDDRMLEAIDVMLELTGGKPAGFFATAPPLLLRFSVGGEKERSFAVLPQGIVPQVEQITPSERLILLFDGQGQVEALPVSNKQFYALRQEDGTHRFFALERGTRRNG